VVYDPCNPVPGTNIPSGLPPVTHHKYAVHHVVGRIRHRLHHKYVHTGPAGGGAPNPYGCEKHAIAPGAGKNAALPTTPFPSAPVSKLAALGGGVVGFGGLGGLIGGFGGGGGGGKHVITGGGGSGGTTGGGGGGTTGGGGGNSGTPQCNVTTDPTCSSGTSPGNPSTPVPEPASVVMFIVAVGAAFLARYMFTRRRAGDSVVSL
jgi:hypothetical protein